MGQSKSQIHYNGPVTLIVLDGFGLSGNPVGNAIEAAVTPVLDKAMMSYPMQKLKASGRAVGLPTDDDIGNSEVGHNAMGAGRVYAQGARLVNESLESGEIFKGKVWKSLVQNAKHDHTLHFIGLLSDGNVHSHTAQLFKLLDEAREEGVPRVRVHILLDGRDVSPQSALEYVDKLEAKLAELGGDYKVASGGGRMQITMDRYDADWAMVERGWRTHVLGEGMKFDSARQAIEAFRADMPDMVDQDIPPFVITKHGKPVGRIVNGDSVVLFNFRGDRAIEIAEALEGGEDFNKFDRGGLKIKFASMLEYDSEKHIPSTFLVSPVEFKNTLGEFLAKNGINQLALSETQKIGHVTYFFNGNRAAKFNPNLEQYIEVPSIPAERVPFDAQPAMKSDEIADKFLEVINTNDFQFVRMNFPNPDMVGHTGNFDATVKAIEAVDQALGKILPELNIRGGMALIVGDHGNAEEMYELNDDGSAKLNGGVPVPKTAHTTNRVPCIFYDNTDNKYRYDVKEGENFGLTNIASTVALLLGLEPMKDWDESIIKLN
ncbi:MAG: 2,3-bisphosphoglycerate-independent phosphoglycerate mutase [Candidatus Nomurabacteria bacterium]|jgi:2,3-bisphosphoglycerate-independent phosphoglycerate mutase|nr:2,3-bisphosphoglycerate-independent phosphoglycerate mutase [Candidatus Nomurabacteria bacterium]